MPSLTQLLATGPVRQRVVDDTVRLIDAEVARKTGLAALALKAGYKVVKGVRPNFVRGAVEALLDDFCLALDPFFQRWSTAPAGARPPLGDALVGERAAVADALLGVTDRRAERSPHGLVRATYSKLRSTAKHHVEEALPGLGRTVEPYLKA